jgi:chaperonin GroES
MIEGEDTTASGIVIPDTAKDKPHRAQVIAVGDSDEVKVGIGDTVVLRKFGGTEVKIDGEDRVIVAAEDILGVVEG